MAPKLPINKFLHELRNSPPNSLVFLSIGNPPKYDKTRHSAGHRIGDRLATDFGTTRDVLDNGTIQLKAISSEKAIFIGHSYEYMNLSGRAALAATRAVQDPHILVVIHDDMDVEVGDVKFKLESKSFGGHNGLKDVAQRYGVFARLRVGIGAPVDRSEAAVLTHVMGKWTRRELELLDTEGYSRAYSMVGAMINALRPKSCHSDSPSI